MRASEDLEHFVAEPIIDPRPRLPPLLVWIIPLLAALIGIGLMAKSAFERGPIITIHFQTAEGLEPEKTKVKYKNVDIGELKAVLLSEDLSHVLARVELSKQAEHFAVEGTRFWVVRPRVLPSGVSGLNTLMSGSYIGVDVAHSSKRQETFIGLETPPSIAGNQKGRQFILHGDSLGSLDINSPVFYRRMQVGKVIAYSLDRDGQGVTLHIFVNAPYDKYVLLNTRFWHASGIDLRLDSNGFKLNSQSLIALMMGGLAFQTTPGVALDQQAPENTAFHLASDENEAMRTPAGQLVRVILNFNQTLRGLAIGAAVDFRGIVLGQVESTRVDYDPQSSAFRMPVIVALYPERLGAAARIDKHAQAAQLLATLVRHGLRAQLRTSNLLTGQLYIALDFFPKAPAPTSIQWSAQPFELPTIPNTLDQLQLQLADIIRKLDKVPFDQIGLALNQTLARTNGLFEQLGAQLAPQATQTLIAARQAFNAAQASLSEDSPLQADMRAALAELTRTLQSLNALADYLARHPEALIYGKKE